MGTLWALSGHDNRADFLDEDADLPRCPECGLLTQQAPAPRRLVGFRPFGRDVTATYDNRLIFSARLAELCRSLFGGQIDWAQIEVGKGESVYAPMPNAIATVAEPRAGIRRGELCETCAQYEYEMLPSPLLVGADSLRADRNVFRTNLEFGEGLGKVPEIIFREQAKLRIDEGRFKGLEWQQVLPWPA